MPEIIVNISPAGQVEIDAQGYEGNSCDAATQNIELVLGGGGRKKEKPEYHMPATDPVRSTLFF